MLGIFLIGVASAITCCERLRGVNNDGAWCQNVEDKSLCADSPFESVSAYCESTSYCKLGTCILQQDGVCMQNTPRKSCENRGGFWSESKRSELSQCQLGCCVIGDQAALVTEIACNKMSILYGGIQTTYLSNIDDEVTCLSNANPGAKGACVFSRENVRTCELTTKKDCQDRQKSAGALSIEFHEGFLCSAPEFQTNCFKTRSTRCDGDDVYFIDSCGNLANIYDSSRIDEDDYWTKIQESTCSDSAGNKNSPTCGDCNYLSGSMCREKETGESVNAGNYICKDLDCKDYRGRYSGSSSGLATAANFPKHGESWCTTDNTRSGTSSSPGASFFRLMCYNGEVTVEQCDPTRQKICSQAKDSTSGYWTGNCLVNRWQDCWQQKTNDDCSNTDLRDCHWVGGYSITDSGIQDGEGICVPNYAPGFDVNGNLEVTGGETCGAASSICYVQVQRGWINGLINPDGTKWGCDEGGIPILQDIPLINLIPGVKGENNCECLGSGLSSVWNQYGGKDYGNSWKEARQNICSQLGDCGNKVNFIGNQGYPQTDIQVITNLSE